MDTKINKIIEDNTVLTKKINSLNIEVEDLNEELIILKHQLSKKEDTVVLLRDCINRFFMQTELSKLVELCSKYITTYFQPDSISFYMGEIGALNFDIKSRSNHEYHFSESNMEMTPLENLTDMIEQMQVPIKKLTMFDLKNIPDTKSAVLCQVKYNGRIFGYVLYKYKEETPTMIDDLLMSIVEVFAASYGALVMNTLMAHYAEDISIAAYTDPKTLIGNTSKLEKDISYYLDEEYTLVLIDIDDFKTINDTYGHDVGDLVLKYFGQKLNEKMNKVGGEGYRDGGDEFVGVSFSPLHETVEVIEELIEEVFNHKFEVDAQTFTITNSIGIYQKQANETFEIARKKADNLLYLSKRKGKKQYSVDQSIKEGGLDDVIETN